MDQNLGNIIKNAKARAAIYGTYVIIGLIVGALQVAFAAGMGDQPDWLTISLAVYAYLGIPVGGLAAVNSTIVPTKVVEAQNVENVQADAIEVGEVDGQGNPIP